MYKEKTENIEVYFICYKKEEMDLVEKYYDKVLDVDCWYFNCYLAYRYWKNKFKKLRLKKLDKMLLVIAASKYLLYLIENEEYNGKEELERIKKDLKLINIELEKINCLFNL